MKNLFKTSMLVIAAFLMSYSAKAALPDLAIATTPPTMITLPQTFSYEGTSSGYIDIDDNTQWDFRFEFSGADDFYISAYSGAYVLVNSGNYMVELLTSGTSIAPTAPTGNLWYSGSTIAHWVSSFGSPLNSTHSDGVTQGYMGVKFYKGSNVHYGWLNIEIDDDNQTVTVKSKGYNETPDAPVMAGAGDPFGSTVPIPFIASAVAMVLAGAGIVFRRKQKK